MPLTERENTLRNASMTGPEWIPIRVVISGATWNRFRGEVEDVLVRHPLLFPGFEKGRRDFDHWDPGPAYRAGERFLDAWGCVWLSAIDGIEGVVVEHPLKDWDLLESYEPPDPLMQGDREPADWEAVQRTLEATRRRGGCVKGFMPHGFLFMRLYYLRGFENCMMDFALDEPRLVKLIEKVNAHNRQRVEKWLSLGLDMMVFGDDLGTQTSSIISPDMFRKWILPGYQELMRPCREAGSLVLLHSDGYIMDLMDAFVEAGVNMINPQDLVNGIDPLAQEVKGRMCIQLDIDRQTIVPYGTPSDIRELIAEEVRKLGAKEGGLELVAGIYPPTPPENIDALLSALEEFRTYWWDSPRGSD